MRGYYFITDRDLSVHGNESDVRDANEMGVPLIQYREKNLPARALFEEAARLKALCSRSRFIVNDRIDIALAVDADGVHIGSEDPPLAVVRRLLGKKRLIGVSVRTLAAAAAAAAAGADYLGVGPIFDTTTKKNAGPGTGIELIREIKKSIRVPLAAIGGITLANAGEVMAAGADMICAVRAVVAAAHPKQAMLQFKELFR